MYLDNNQELIINRLNNDKGFMCRLTPDHKWFKASPEAEPYVEELYKACKTSSKLSDSEKTLLIEKNVKIILDINNGVNVAAPTVSFADAREAAQKMIDFMTEFHFVPGFRFINTFALVAKKGANEAKEFVKNYFELSDSAYSESIGDKMKSVEFSEIIDKFKKFTPSTTVNTRFEIWYGEPGTGKTTLAMTECNDNCMVCHNGMLPQDLMEDFEFCNGQPTFRPSALQDAIVNGKTIVLDELNLLPFESLRFLQSVLDGKKQFEYKGATINVADGFKVIGTMNLVVNSTVCALPEPLIDRASTLRKFNLTASQLVGALL